MTDISGLIGNRAGGAQPRVFVNIAMATGSLPVVGVTLLFFSYGGSSLLASMIAIGLLMNVSMRRFTF